MGDRDRSSVLIEGVDHGWYTRDYQWSTSRAAVHAVPFSLYSPRFSARVLFRSRPFRSAPSVRRPVPRGRSKVAEWLSSFLPWVLILVHLFSLRSRPQHAFVLEGFPADSRRGARHLHWWVCCIRVIVRVCFFKEARYSPGKLISTRQSSRIYVTSKWCAGLDL